MFPPLKKKPMPMKPPGGGISAPPPIGGVPEPDADDMGGPPDHDADDKAGMLSAETVGYHEEAHNCGNCKHQQNGNCEVIGQQVANEGGCSVWEDGGSQMSAGAGMADMSQAPAPYPS
jgi:hypothetical protein